MKCKQEGKILDVLRPFLRSQAINNQILINWNALHHVIWQWITYVECLHKCVMNVSNFCDLFKNLLLSANQSFPSASLVAVSHIKLFLHILEKKIMIVSVGLIVPDVCLRVDLSSDYS